MKARELNLSLSWSTADKNKSSSNSEFISSLPSNPRKIKNSKPVTSGTSICFTPCKRSKKRRIALSKILMCPKWESLYMSRISNRPSLFLRHMVHMIWTMSYQLKLWINMLKFCNIRFIFPVIKHWIIKYFISLVIKLVSDLKAGSCSCRHARR